MDSFERREAKLRAQEKWAVVRKSVLPEKDEFLEKANKGKSEEWLEHWNKRRKTQTKLKATKFQLYIGKLGHLLCPELEGHIIQQIQLQLAKPQLLGELYLQ